MIKKIIIIAVVLFGIYNITLHFWLKNRGALYTDVDKVERFLYSGNQYKVITAGSSLIGSFTRLSSNRSDFYNLSLPPSGGCTGVRTIVLSGKIPDTLYLETNYLSRGVNQQLLDELFDPLTYQMKFYFPALEKSNKFIPLLISKLKPPVEISSKRPAKKLFDKLLAINRIEYNAVPDATEYNKILTFLAHDLQYLTKKGCKIVFFEVPIEREFVNSPKLVYQRKKLKAFFRDKNYKWIEPDTSNIYYTGDGKHLLNESFDRFNTYFKKKALLLKSGNS
jgi:hypothetical protein